MERESLEQFAQRYTAKQQQQRSAEVQEVVTKVKQADEAVTVNYQDLGRVIVENAQDQALKVRKLRETIEQHKARFQ